MSVDPDSVVTIPMPRHPTPVSSTSPVARPMGVIWLIAHLDIDSNRIRGGGESVNAKQSSEKQSKFLHSCFLW